MLNNLRSVRRVLKKEKLEDKYIHRLIARSILILCLEDRGALKEYFKVFRDNQYSSFREIQKKDHAYELFYKINEHFNGDVFPITEEEKNTVTERHYGILREFLLGTDPESHQRRLWPYRFDIIPIEFISNIYEEFFHNENEPLERQSKSSNLGTYYTPQSLVNFVLDDMICWEAHRPNLTVLNPSCGSGIFLVEAYRKIIERKISQNNFIEASELKDILEHNIFGVDINKDAVSITAFSLYLTMLDYIPPDRLWEKPKLFPKLIDVTLFGVDFFDTFAPFNKMKFDLIVGNVPWLSVNKSSNTKALRYSKLAHRTIGDRQIAQAFVWKALDLVENESEICLIVGAKNVLFNRSHNNTLFRKELLQNADIRTIVNLSILRHSLFNKSVGPATIIHYQKKTSENNSVVYICPKTSLETKYVGAIVIDKSDYSIIPLELAFEDDTIWKVAMWGTPRDLQLVSRLRNFGTLGQIIDEKQLEMGDGFQRTGGNRKKSYAPWLLEIPYLPATAMEKYEAPDDALKSIDHDPFFLCPRIKKRYTAPLCLIKVTLKDGDIVSAFSNRDIAYTDGVIGISGTSKDVELLKIICCYLNSEIAKYLLFLTCSVWGVERDDILKDDLVKLPLRIPDKGSEAYINLLSIYDNIIQSKTTNKEQLEILTAKIDNIFLNLLEINDKERKLIEDTIRFTINYFQKKDESIAVEPVSLEMLCGYASQSLSLLNSTAKENGSVFNSKIYFGNRGLKVVLFSLENEMDVTQVEVTNNSEELNKLLDDILKRLRAKKNENILLRKITRIYDGTRVFIVKPNERRYWTSIEAYRDTDEMLSEVFDAWREEGLVQKVNTVQ